MSSIRYFSLLSVLMAFFLSGNSDTLQAQSNTLKAAPTTMSFTAPAGGTTPPAQKLVVTATGASMPFVSVTQVISPIGGNWLFVTPAGGSTPAELTVFVVPTNLAAGTYTGLITLIGVNTVTVQVTFTVTSPTGIAVSPNLLSFNFQTGTNPGSKTLRVTSTGAAVSFTVTIAYESGLNWLLVNPASGTTPRDLEVGLNTAALPPTGNFKANINIASSAGTLSVPVSVSVGDKPELKAQPASMSFYHQIGTTTTPMQTLELSSSGTDVSFSVGVSTSQGGSWLVASPLVGATPVSLAVSVSPAGLGAGTYNGKIRITSAASLNSPVDVPVTLLVSPNPLLSAAPSTLEFNYQVGGTQPSNQMVNLTSTGTQFAYTATAATKSGGSWLTVGTPSGTTPASITVGVVATSLNTGTYEGTVTVTAPDAANNPLTIPVKLNVSETPLLSLSANSLAFAYQTGGTAPAIQPIAIESTGEPLNFGATVTTISGGQWLQVNQSGGTTPAAINISVNPSGLEPATYKGQIRITSQQAANSPQVVEVTLVVASDPLLVLSPGTLNFTAQVNQPSPANQAVAVTSTSGSALPFTATSTGGNWLLFGPNAASTPNNLNVGVISTGLTPGEYAGSIVVASEGVPNSPQTVTVKLKVVPAANLEVSPASLSFSQNQGGAPPEAKTITVESSAGDLSYNAAVSTAVGGDWLKVTPSSGTTPGTVSVSVDGKSLAVGTYTGSITISSGGAGNGPQTIGVTLTIAAPPRLTVTPTILSFNALVGGPNPASQAVSVTLSPGAANFTVATATTTGGIWLSATPPNGTTPGTVTVNAASQNLAAGTYNGTVTITVPGALGSPSVVAVTLKVAGQPVTPSPTSLTFNYASGGAVPAAQEINVTSSVSGVTFEASAKTTTGGSWLSVSPASGATPAKLSVSVSPGDLAAGAYQGTVEIVSDGVPVTVAVNLNVTQQVRPAVARIANGASQGGTGISAGLIVTVYGSNLGPANPASLRVGTDGKVTTILAETRVLFDGIAAPMLYTSNGQINCVAPYELANRTATRVEVEYLGVRSLPVDIRVDPSAPGIFTNNSSGSGQGAVLNQDNSLNSATNPADRGSVLVIFATGEGQTQPASVNGAVTGANPPKPVLAVTATVGGVEGTIEYAGSAPGLVAGVLQVNVRMASSTPSGQVPVVIRVGNAVSQTGVTVAVK